MTGSGHCFSLIRGLHPAPHSHVPTAPSHPPTQHHGEPRGLPFCTQTPPVAPTLHLPKPPKPKPVPRAPAARWLHSRSSQRTPVYPASQAQCPVTASQLPSLPLQLQALAQPGPQRPPSQAATGGARPQHQPSCSPSVGKGMGTALLPSWGFIPLLKREGSRANKGLTGLWVCSRR